MAFLTSENLNHFVMRLHNQAVSRGKDPCSIHVWTSTSTLQWRLRYKYQGKIQRFRPKCEKCRSSMACCLIMQHYYKYVNNIFTCEKDQNELETFCPFSQVEISLTCLWEDCFISYSNLWTVWITYIFRWIFGGNYTFFTLVHQTFRYSFLCVMLVDFYLRERYLTKNWILEWDEYTYIHENFVNSCSTW